MNSFARCTMNSKTMKRFLTVSHLNTQRRSTRSSSTSPSSRWRCSATTRPTAGSESCSEPSSTSRLSTMDEVVDNFDRLKRELSGRGRLPTNSMAMRQTSISAGKIFSQASFWLSVVRHLTFPSSFMLILIFSLLICIYSYILFLQFMFLIKIFS